MTRDRLEQILALEDTDFITSANVAFNDIKEEMRNAGYPTNPDGYKAYTASNPETADLFKQFSDRTLKINRNEKTKAIPLPKKAEETPVVEEPTKAEEAPAVEPAVVAPVQNIVNDEVELAPFANNGANQTSFDEANTEAIPVVSEELPETADTKKADVYEKNAKGKKWAKRIGAVALAGAALFGIVKLGQGCVSKNVNVKSETTEDVKKEQSQSEFVNNADEMMKNASDVLNGTRAYGNNATAKEMFEFMLVANYNDISKDPNFLANLQMNLTTDEQKAFIENFLGTSDLLNTNLTQEDLQRIFNQKGAMNNLILSYSVQLNDQDAVANKKLSNYSSLFADKEDKTYINQLMNYINDATYNSGDSAKVQADLDAAAQLVSNSVKDGSNIGYGAQYTGITLFNDIMNYKFTDSIDDTVTEALTVCKGNMTISENAENVAFKVRQEADGILLKLEEGKNVEFNADNGKTFEAYMNEISNGVKTQYVSAIDRANGDTSVTAEASTNDSSASSYVDSSTGSSDTSTWTVENDSQEVTTFDATTAEQSEAKQEAAQQEAKTESDAAAAASGQQIGSTSGEVSNTDTGVTAQTDSTGNGTISVVTDDGQTKTAEISSTNTADQNNQAIADATGDTKEEVEQQTVYDENNNVEKNADGSDKSIGQVIVENNEDVKKAAEQAQAEADALIAQGFVETTNDNVVGNNQAAVATPEATASSLSK